MRLIRSAVIVSTLFSIACSGTGALDLPNSPGDKVTRQVIEYVKAGEIETALGFFDGNELPANAADLLAETTPLLSETSEVDLINFRYFKSFKVDRIDEEFAYHAKGDSCAALVFASTRTSANKTEIRTFRVHQSPIDLTDIYPFVILGMGPLHYVILLASILVPVFILVTVVAIAKSSRQRKWLWVLFSVVGIGKLGIQWVVGGRWFLQLIAVQILGASRFKNPLYEPWILSVSLPLGAILFWVTNRHKSSKQPPPEEHEGTGRGIKDDSREPPNPVVPADSNPAGFDPLNSDR